MSRLAKLAELKRLRNEGVTRETQYSDSDEDKELSDGGIPDADFVVDDIGDGEYIYGETEEPPPKRNSRNVSKTTTPRDRNGRRDGDIGSFFRRPLPTSKPSFRGMGQLPNLAKTESAGTQELDDIISSVGSSRKRTRSRPSVDTPTPAPRISRPRPFAIPRMMPPQLPTEPQPNAEDQQTLDNEEAALNDPQVIEPPIQEAADTENLRVPEPILDSEPPSGPSIESNDDLPSGTPLTPAPSDDRNGLDEEIMGTGSYGSASWRTNLVSEPTQINQNQQAPTEFEDGGELQFYWLDYAEVGTSLVLFGRTSAGESVSLAIRGLMQDVYFLPRPGKTPHDVQAEIRPRLNLPVFRSKPVQRRYCFGDPNVPRGESTYLSVLVPHGHNFNLPSEGETYSHIFGRTETLFESFVLSRNVMGPCWLTVTQVKRMQNATWSRIDVECQSPSCVTPKENDKMPQLTLMSISLRTAYVQSVKNRPAHHEIVAISARIYRTDHDTTTSPTELPNTLITGVRPPPGEVMPPGFKDLLAEHNSKVKTVFEHRSERQLIGWFMAKLQQLDPDVFLAHSSTNIHLAILLQRALDLEEHSWSRLGRLRLARKPKQVTQWSVQQVCAGRLICDLNNTFGQELTRGSCSSFTLDEMTRVFLDQARVSHDYNVTSSPWLAQGAAGIMKIIRHNEADTLYTIAIVIKLQILALSRNLTSLAGNSWARTLAGTRSGRNDFLLMHEFTRNQYIVPDRPSRENANSGDKHEKYQGGAVFEPEKGLYRTPVLVMDFNSLYPSLIQEYNICFTTITDAEAELTTKEASHKPQGILPKVIQALVQRRQQVKKLMKDPKATKEQLAQWDTRQQALKLTANSMYGCLGLAGSRFAARSLAMLVTAKGRETLQRTRDLAEQNHLQVVYGDTDSVMIHTAASEYNEAIQIGNKFKRLVNEQYRAMEIDIDNVFGSLLLYAKKKYAAMNMVPMPDGSIKQELQIKGLDLRRREYSQVCKDASMKTLELLFNSGDDSFETIISYLEKLGNDMRTGKIGLSKYVIRNQLSKEVADYPEHQRLPQLKVARDRIAAGDVVRAKDVVAYVIAAGTAPPAERAYTLSSLRKDGLELDIGWYLEHQILQPVERLCLYVPGFDAVRLAEALGVSRKAAITNGAAQSSYQGLETAVDDTERFADCKPLELRSTCGNLFHYTGLEDTKLTNNGIVCPQCSNSLSPESVIVQLEKAVRSEISRYYQNWLVCEEHDCGHRTRQISVYGRRCCQPHCRGTVRYEYTDKQLYNQLSYYAALFDGKRADPKQMRQAALAQHNRLLFYRAGMSVDKYLKQNGRRYVDMGRIFARV